MGTHLDDESVENWSESSVSVETTYTSARANLASIWDRVLEDRETVIVKRRGGGGACLLELLDRVPEDVDELDRLAAESGFAAELIRDAMDAPITAADIRAAPEALRVLADTGAASQPEVGGENGQREAETPVGS